MAVIVDGVEKSYVSYCNVNVDLLWTATFAKSGLVVQREIYCLICCTGLT